MVSRKRHRLLTTKPLSIVMPVFNEAHGLEAAVTEVYATLSGRGYDIELIVVDDVSSDGTYALACQLSARFAGLRALKHERNLGPCSGLVTGARVARHDWVLLLPADLAIPLEDVEVLWEARGRGDVVVGFLRDATSRDGHRQLQSKAYTVLINALFGLGVPQVNYVTLYKTSVLRSMQLKTVGVARHAEILVRARKAGHSLATAALGYRPRTSGEATGSKPRVIAKTLWEILKLRASL